MSYLNNIKITLVIIIIFCMIGCRQFEQTKVCFKDICFDVELAITPAQRKQGLMFRKYLSQNQGMLFVFEDEDKHSFWMKNTFIPLDIIWIDKNKEVVFIERNVQPCEQDICSPIIPEQKAKYVLELNAGTCEDIGLKIKDKINFSPSIDFILPNYN
jgi:uncharacterized membrane protein (UPF0127 family)